MFNFIEVDSISNVFYLGAFSQPPLWLGGLKKKVGGYMQ